MSRSSSKNLSNRNKHWCFYCLQEKKWIKILFLWKHSVFVFILLRFFDNLFDVINDDPFWRCKRLQLRSTNKVAPKPQNCLITAHVKLNLGVFFHFKRPARKILTVLTLLESFLVLIKSLRFLYCLMD